MSFVVGTVVITAASPALAQPYRRSCHFVVEVNPIGPGEGVTYSFRVFRIVQSLREANDGRRDIRQHVTICVRGHWNDRNETRPYACQDWGYGSDMEQYPFDNMYQQIRQDICHANRAPVRRHNVPVNIEMYIRGERGCLERSEDRGVDPVAIVSIARNFNFDCPRRPPARR
jgi:hypothetical protein